jgi:hypothetical protein
MIDRINPEALCCSVRATQIWVQAGESHAYILFTRLWKAKMLRKENLWKASAGTKRSELRRKRDSSAGGSSGGSSGGSGSGSGSGSSCVADGGHKQKAAAGSSSSGGSVGGKSRGGRGKDNNDVKGSSDSRVAEGGQSVGTQSTIARFFTRGISVPSGGSSREVRSAQPEGGKGAVIDLTGGDDEGKEAVIDLTGHDDV